jgi:hypothetical protein
MSKLRKQKIPYEKVVRDKKKIVKKRFGSRSLSLASKLYQTPRDALTYAWEVEGQTG